MRFDNVRRVAETAVTITRRLARVLAVGAAVWSLAGCFSAQQRAFEDRDPLPSCGEHRLHDGQPLADAVACLVEAQREGRGAELTILRSTVEGDPIITYYRARPGKRGYEIFDDNTKDRYASGGWHYRICDHVELQRAELIETGCR